MMQLWIVFLLLLAIGVIAFIWPLLCSRADKKNGPSRDEMNKVYYQHRLSELMQDEQQGLVAESASLVQELQQNLLEDIPDENNPRKTTKAQQRKRFDAVILLPGMALLIGVSLMVYYTVGGYSKVEEWQSVVARLPELRHQLIEKGPEGMGPNQMAALAVGIRHQVQQQPDNLADWVLLGRLGMYMGDMSTGINAFAHASELAPDDIDIQLGYAELLVRSQENDDNIKASVVLVKILSQEGNNIQALSLFGYNAFELKDYVQAIRAWQVLLNNLPPNDKRIQMIEDSIAMARKQMLIPSSPK